MYNEKIENLIKAALADGELTEKEKQILFKRAEAEGIDLDEFEMVLDARLVELKKQEAEQALEHELEMAKIKASTPSSAPKSNKFGDIRKCPACGAMIQSFQAKCPECGHEFSNIEGNSSMEKLQNMLIEADKSAENAGVFSQMSSIMRGGASAAVQRKSTIIQNFPIPNTKDDLMEFITMAAPNAKKMGIFENCTPDDRWLNDSWRKKLEQIFIKARVMLKDDREVMDLVNYYSKELKIKVK